MTCPVLRETRLLIIDAEVLYPQPFNYISRAFLFLNFVNVGSSIPCNQPTKRAKCWGVCVWIIAVSVGKRTSKPDSKPWRWYCTWFKNKIPCLYLGICSVHLIFFYMLHSRYYIYSSIRQGSLWIILNVWENSWRIF
jgi:hypothetical protein